SVTVATTGFGQNASVTFQGTQGDRVFVQNSGWAFQYASGSNGCVDHTLKKPDGSYLWGTSGWCGNNNFIDLGETTLPATGTYTLYINPQSTATGSETLTFYRVPADYSGSLSIGGSAVTFAISTPGQNAWLPFAGTAGKGIHLIASQVTIPNST